NDEMNASTEPSCQRAVASIRRLAPPPGPLHPHAHHVVMTRDAHTPVIVTTESEILERRRTRHRALYSDLPRQAYSSFGFDPEMPDIPRGIDRAVAEVRIRDLVDELLESDELLRPVIEMADFRRD